MPGAVTEISHDTKPAGYVAKLEDLVSMLTAKRDLLEKEIHAKQDMIDYIRAHDLEPHLKHLMSLDAH